jgi:hypothetical protein
MPQILLSKKQAREAICYGPRALDYAIAAGELAIVRHGRRVFVRPEALSEFAHRDRPSMCPKPKQAQLATQVTEHREEPGTPSSDAGERGSTNRSASRTKAESDRLRRRRQASEGE